MSFGNKGRWCMGAVITVGLFIVFGVVCGLVSWAGIELLLWLFSFVHTSFGG